MNTNSVISIQVADSTTIAAHRRVKLSSGKAALAGASDVAIGTNLQDVDSTVTGRNICDIHRIPGGIHYATYGTSTALSVGDEVQAAANGKVTKIAAGTAIGIALNAATADGDIIQVVYYN